MGPRCDGCDAVSLFLALQKKEKDNAETQRALRLRGEFVEG